MEIILNKASLVYSDSAGCVKYWPMLLLMAFDPAPPNNQISHPKLRTTEIGYPRSKKLHGSERSWKVK